MFETETSTRHVKQFNWSNWVDSHLDMAPSHTLFSGLAVGECVMIYMDTLSSLVWLGSISPK